MSRFSEHMPASEFAVVVPELLGNASAYRVENDRGIALRRSVTYPVLMGDHVQLEVDELTYQPCKQSNIHSLSLVRSKVEYGLRLTGFDTPEGDLRAKASKIMVVGGRSFLDRTVFTGDFGDATPAATFGTAIYLAATARIEDLVA